MPRLRLLHGGDGAAAEVLLAFARALAPLVASELRAGGRGDEDPIVDVLVELGIGDDERGAKDRRAAYAACRGGAIAGSGKLGRRWRAPRSAIRSWLAASRPASSRTDPADTDTETDDDLEDERRALAGGA